MKKLAILALGVLSLVACTDQKVVNYNTARLDIVEDYLRNHKYVKPSENLDKLIEDGKIEYAEEYVSLEKEAKQWERKNSTTIMVMLFLLIFSLPALAVQALTTTQMRENSIRINALELKNVDILNSEAPKEMTIVLDERSLNFDFDKSNVKPQYYDLLNNIKEFVEQNNYEITIVGHTDSIGSNAYNFKLSRRRAESVKAKLLEFGLSEDRIVGIEAMGEEQPIATNATKEGRAQNRRVEFKLVQRETIPMPTESK